MRYWVREIAGWLLVLLGLLIFDLAYEFCVKRQVFEAWPVTIIGIFVFRGGIHLLKVAVAARVCQQAQDRLYPASTGPTHPASPAARRSTTPRRDRGWA